MLMRKRKRKTEACDLQQETSNKFNVVKVEQRVNYDLKTHFIKSSGLKLSNVSYIIII